MTTEQNNGYKTTVGLEIHAELKTTSKMFCGCKNDPYEINPNVNVCPVCMGHPGTLPVINKEAVKKVIKVGLAIGGKIADFTEWDRKHYFYPDIPKGYQLSQYKYPLVEGGQIGGIKLTRIHLEEDTAKSSHDTGNRSLVDFNRSGMPLMELVTEPVIHNSIDAVNFARDLQRLMRYLDAGDVNMEMGQMRVEANISVSKTDTFGTKTEVKNLNSFRSVGKAIEFEVKRQIALLEKGEKVVQETRGWNDVKGETFSQRLKESSHDYRYFPDPDLPKMKISEIAELSIDKLKKEIPELPWERRQRIIKDYGARDIDAEIFVDSDVLTNYFEKIITSLSGSFGNLDNSKKDSLIKNSLNYLITDYLGLLKKDGSKKVVEKDGAENTKEGVAGGEVDFLDNINKISAENFAKLMLMLNAGTLSSRGVKDTLLLMYKGDIRDPEIIAKENGLIQVHDEKELEKTVREVLNNNQKIVDEYKAGKLAVLQYLIGQCMKATKGSANPDMLRGIIVKVLS